MDPIALVYLLVVAHQSVHQSFDEGQNAPILNRGMVYESMHQSLHKSEYVYRLALTLPVVTFARSPALRAT